MNKWIAIIALGIVSLAAGCKQGIGERCQVNSDCMSDLCSTSEPKVCVNTTETSGDIDATVPDAPIDSR